MPYDPKTLDDDRTPPPPTDAPRYKCEICHKPITGEKVVREIPWTRGRILEEYRHPECHGTL